jgi:DNA-binding CsgD family transcriptional regulator
MIGRSADLETLRAFVERSAAAGGALIIVGEPGVGKTTLLDHAADVLALGDRQVLRAAGAEFEADISYAGLSQLILPIAAEARSLDSIYASALGTVLGLGDGTPPEGRVVVDALSLLLRRQAHARPVLLVVDDLHWLDRATADVLSALARRLKGIPVALLGSVRGGEVGFFECGGLEQHHLLPLSEDESAALLASRYPTLSSRVRCQVLAGARGNPLAIVEVPAGLSASASGDDDLFSTAIPLSQRLQAAFASRLALLEPRTRRALLLAALEATGNVAVLRAAVGEDLLETLVPAELARLVWYDDLHSRLSFTHPLTRAAVISKATAAERRLAHAALADATYGDPDRRAWHLARATLGPDESAASALEEAAYRMLRRGDPVGAVTALLRASDLSPGPADRSRRMAEAAYIGSNVTGELRGAVQLLDRGQRAAVGGSLQAAIASANVLLNSDGAIDTAHRLLASAIGIALDHDGGNSQAARDDALTEAMNVLMMISWFGGRRELWQAYHALLDRVPEPPRLASLEAAVFADPVRATQADLAELDRRIGSLHLEANPAAIIRLANMGNYVDRTTDCRESLARLIRGARAGGAIASGIDAMMLLAGENFREGLWDEARQLADEGAALSESHGYHHLRLLHKYHQALLAAGRGEADTVRVLTGDLTGWATPRGGMNFLRYAAHVRTLSAIGQGDFDEAYRQASTISPPGTFPRDVALALRVPLELVEAAVRSGRPAEAAAHVASMQDAGLPALSRRLAFLTAGAAALADPSDSLFEAALGSPGARRWPFEFARIQLAYGEHLRRTRARVRARVQLAATMETFERLDATPWVAHAASQLRACGQVRTDGHAETLSAREREIATLAASGLTNKQIGDRLFLSPRTVGDYLYKIFPKLGIATRAALRDALDEELSPVRSP